MILLAAEMLFEPDIRLLLCVMVPQGTETFFMHPSL
jgi:hypothetical protein